MLSIRAPHDTSSTTICKTILKNEALYCDQIKKGTCSDSDFSALGDAIIRAYKNKDASLEDSTVCTFLENLLNTARDANRLEIINTLTPALVYWQHKLNYSNHDQNKLYSIHVINQTDTEKPYIYTFGTRVHIIDPDGKELTQTIQTMDLLILYDLSNAEFDQFSSEIKKKITTHTTHITRKTAYPPIPSDSYVLDEIGLSNNIANVVLLTLSERSHQNDARAIYESIVVQRAHSKTGPTSSLQAHSLYSATPTKQPDTTQENYFAAIGCQLI